MFVWRSRRGLARTDPSHHLLGSTVLSCITCNPADAKRSWFWKQISVIMVPEPKRRKLQQTQSQNTRKVNSSTPARTEQTQSNQSSPVVLDNGSEVLAKIQHAKNFAVAQAQQDGSTGNYRIFDSPFGNFLLPVIPTRAELGG